MTAEFWLERWQEGAIGFHQGDINAHLQNYWPQLNPLPGNTVFVPLCGKTSDMIWLQSQSLSVLGIEISPIAIQDFFAENGLRPEVSKQGPFRRWQSSGLTLLEGDIFQLTRQDAEAISHVFDRASLVALPPEVRAKYARHLRTVLPEHANVLLVAFEYDQREMDGPPFAVREEEVRQLYGDGYAIELLHQQDVLGDYARFKERGLRELRENVYLLQPRQV